MGRYCRNFVHSIHFVSDKPGYLFQSSSDDESWSPATKDEDEFRVTNDSNRTEYGKRYVLCISTQTDIPSLVIYPIALIVMNVFIKSSCKIGRAHV